MSKKILITGMTAQQYSSAVAQRSMTYASTLEKALTRLGYSVTISEPSVTWTADDVNQYDKVFIGISSPISLAANSAYGALSLISRIGKSSKVVFFLDAPEPGKIFAGLRAIYKNPSTLVKPLYARRRGYRDVLDSKQVRYHAYAGVEALLELAWPTTLFPALPWDSDPLGILGLTDEVTASMQPLTFDAMYLSPAKVLSANNVPRDVWGIDVTSTRWAKSMESATTLPIEKIKTTKTMSEEDIKERISSFIGVLLTSYDDKRSWWSPRYVQAINASTPIITDWRKSEPLGFAWTFLPSAIEKSSRVDRYELSAIQRQTYRDKIQSEEEALTLLEKVVEEK